MPFQVDTKTMIIAGGGLGLLALMFMKGKSTSAAPAVDSATGTDYQSTGTLYVPTSSYTISYNTNSNNVTNSSTVTAQEAPQPTPVPQPVPSPVSQSTVPIVPTQPTTYVGGTVVPMGVPGAVQPGQPTPDRGTPVAYNPSTGLFQKVPSSYNESTGQSTLATTFGDGTKITNPITISGH